MLTKIDLMDKGTDAVDVSLRIASQIGAFRVLFGHFSEMCVSGLKRSPFDIKLSGFDGFLNYLFTSLCNFDIY